MIRRGENRQRSGSEAPEYVTVEAPDEGGEWVRAAFTVAEWATGTSRARKNPEDFEPEMALPSEDQVVAWLLAEANRDPEARSDAMRSLLRHGRSIGRYQAGRYPPWGEGGPPFPTLQVAPSLTYPTPTSAQLVLHLIVTDPIGVFTGATTTFTKPGGATEEQTGLEPTVTGLTTAGTLSWSIVLHTDRGEDTAPQTGSVLIELSETTAPTALYEATGDGFALEVEDQSTGTPTLVRLDLGDGTKVVIGEAAIAHFHSITDGLAVTLVDTSQGIPTGTTTVVWGDGSEPESKVTGSVFRHTYAVPGEYTPILTASNDYGTDTYEEAVEVGVPAPVAAAALSSFGLVATAAIPATRYIASAVLTWGDGQTTVLTGEDLEEGYVAEHTYAGAGTYSAYLTVTNASGTDATDPVALTVAPAQPETIEVASTVFWPLQIDLENLLNIGADTLSVRQVVRINGVDTYHRTHVVTPDQVGVKIHTYWFFHEGDTVQLRYTPWSGAGATGTSGPTTVVDFTIPVDPATQYDDYGIVRLPYRTPSGARPDMTGATEIVLGMPGDLTADYTNTNLARDAAVAAGATNRVVLRVKNGATMPTIVPKAGNSYPIVVEPFSKSHIPIYTTGFRLEIHDPYGIATPWFEATGTVGHAQHAMSFENSAHDWYFQGVGFRPAAANSADLNALVDMSPENATLTEHYPRRITWQHCPFRGRNLGALKAASLPLRHVRTGISGTGEDVAVMGCDFDEIEIKATSSDGQCVFVGGTGGTEGGWRIRYNRFRGGTETIMLGAGGSLDPNGVARNITIEDNELCFPNRFFPDKPEFDNVTRLYKNWWEIKNARLVLFQRNWCHTFRKQANGSQNTGINLKLGQKDTQEYADFADVTIRWNVCEDIGADAYSLGISGLYNISGTNVSAYNTRRVSIYGNRFVLGPGGGAEAMVRAAGFLDSIGKGLPDVIVDHNLWTTTDTRPPGFTWWANPASNPGVDSWTHILPATLPNSPGRMRFTNNVFDESESGIKALSPSISPANKALPYFANFDPIAGNIMAGETLGVYAAKDPANPDSYNVSVDNKDALPFIDRTAGDFRINPASPYAVGGALYVGTDGRNPGPDHDVLDLVRARAVAGVWTS